MFTFLDCLVNKRNVLHCYVLDIYFGSFEKLYIKFRLTKACFSHKQFYQIQSDLRCNLSELALRCLFLFIYVFIS